MPLVLYTRRPYVILCRNTNDAIATIRERVVSTNKFHPSLKSLSSRPLSGVLNLANRDCTDQGVCLSARLPNEHEYFYLPLILPPCGGGGPILDVLQYQANPCKKWSKPLPFSLLPKISLISKPPVGERIRY